MELFKKKRGRKPLNKDVNNELNKKKNSIIVLKKRGRKPKNNDTKMLPKDDIDSKKVFKGKKNNEEKENNEEENNEEDNEEDNNEEDSNEEDNNEEDNNEEENNEEENNEEDNKEEKDKEKDKEEKEKEKKKELKNKNKTKNKNGEIIDTNEIKKKNNCLNCSYLLCKETGLYISINSCNMCDVCILSNECKKCKKIKKKNNECKNADYDGDSLNENIKELKKRGRKPKPHSPEDLLPKVPKKRGRKPKDNYGFNNKKEENKIYDHLNDNIILHLPINSNDISKIDLDEETLLKYNPNISIPEPYEPFGDQKMLIHSPYPFDLKKENINDLNNKLNNKLNNNLNNEYLDNNIINHSENTESNTELNTETNLKETSIEKKNENTKNEDVDENEYKSQLLNKIEDNYVNDIKLENDIIDKNVRDNSLGKYEVFFELNNKSRIFNENMKDFKKSNNHKISPPETDINCWWCCHEFSNSPFVLPIKKIDDCIHSIGCFCSPECAASWNFNSDKRNNDIWESYSLLNLLYRKCYNETIFLKIKFAPPRESLLKFGGPLSIQEFRNSNNCYNKKIKTLVYPLISLIPQMEEVFLNITDKNNNFVPLDLNRLKKVNNELKLKREKPVADSSNTLESCMNLKYINTYAF